MLRHLEQKPDMTQRELAAALGGSVGQVNYCMQALIERGLVKAANFRNSGNKRAYLYKRILQGLAKNVAPRFFSVKRVRCDWQVIEG
ncbi:MarR family EPS-associated transcriptional regulator [Nitrococcus mobilis]|uniref:Uncharacterized protein n=1 Tax=Nitrococcus mobilis Nb-231 TaxID=314278 RepID=A4BMF0_9GAMM|nr:hypothetical protein NB231_16748 [Nitrococcus mobilis Nb-231]